MPELYEKAYRWVTKFGKNILEPIYMADQLENTKLIGIDDQVKLVYQNIEHLTRGNPALNILLWGEKGCGKSTLIRNLSLDFHSKGLRVIEFCTNDIYSIYDLYELLRNMTAGYFIIYIDDLSFYSTDKSYHSLNSILDGGLEKRPDNTIFIVTTNKRHITTPHISVHDADMSIESSGRDIYQRDAANESTSMYSRFGIAVGFYPMNKEQYLLVAEYYLQKLTAVYDGWELDALSFALERGGFSGRTAKQFAHFSVIKRIEL